MCLLVYISAKAPLNPVVWNSEAPSFHVTALDDSAPSVRRQFSFPYVYYAGSHEGCGCGFQSEYTEYEDEERYLKRNSLNEFSSYLVDQLRDVSEIELYACWAGDEDAEVTENRHLHPLALQGDSFSFKQKEKIKFDLKAPAPLTVRNTLEAGYAAFTQGHFYDAWQMLMPQADLGNAEAQFLVGRMLLDGNSVSKDERSAVKWITRAAWQGHFSAQFKLGQLLEYGVGVQQDFVSAFMWLSLARQGDKNLAEEEIQSLSREMTPEQIVKGKNLAASWRRSPLLPLVPNWRIPDATVDVSFQLAEENSPIKDFFSWSISINDEFYHCKIIGEVENANSKQARRFLLKFTRPDLAMPALWSNSNFNLNYRGETLGLGRLVVQSSE